MRSSILRLLCGLLLSLMGAVAAYATPVYRWVYAGSGDTVSLSGLADNGNVLLTGFGDSCGRSAVRQFNSSFGTYSDRQFVIGLPNGQFAECGVSVSRFNSAGDMVGTSRRDGVFVPTFWRGGVAFDLRDPGNSGLVFVPDALAVSARGVDLSALNILEPNPDIRFGSEFYLRALFTNALGMFGAESSRFNNTGYVLIPIVATVPEPSVALLMVAGFLVLVARQRLAGKTG
jgi:hypothetical protein